MCSQAKMLTDGNWSGLFPIWQKSERSGNWKCWRTGNIFLFENATNARILKFSTVVEIGRKNTESWFEVILPAPSHRSMEFLFLGCNWYFSAQLLDFQCVTGPMVFICIYMHGCNLFFLCHLLARYWSRFYISCIISFIISYVIVYILFYIISYIIFYIIFYNIISLPM